MPPLFSISEINLAESCDKTAPKKVDRRIPPFGTHLSTSYIQANVSTCSPSHIIAAVHSYFALRHFYTLPNHTCNIRNRIAAVVLEPF